MKMIAPRLAALLPALMLPLLAVAAPLSLDHFLQWEDVSAPQISPDGKSIVYGRISVLAHEDRFDHKLWVMDGDGARNRFLTEGSQAVWSPDGRRLAFTRSTAAGTTEIFTRWMDADGATTQLTRADLKPTDLSWSPDGKWIAFRGTVPAPSSWTISLPRPAGAKWTEEPTVVDSLHYRMDRVGLRTGYKHLFIVAADGGTPRQLTSGHWHVGANMAGLDITSPFEWTPDGKAIVFSADRQADHEKHYRRSSLHAVDIDTGSIRQITQTPGFWGGLMTGPRLSPDGRTVAFIGHVESKSNFPNRELRIARVDGTSERTLIADLPGYVYSMHWSPDGRGLYYVVEKHGARNVHYVSLDGKVRDITSGPQVLTVTSVAKNGVAVATRRTAEKPTDVVRFELKSGRRMEQLTAVNDDVLRDVELGETEEIWYDSSEGARVQGWIVRPPSFDPARKYPLILMIHGGPEIMFDAGFSFQVQEMAASGYIVLLTNPRGSTGYGGAFSRAIDSAFPGQRDFDDLMNGVDAVIARGYVDTERLYVMGASGGGALTAWIVGHTDRFAGAASLRPVIDWISFAGTTDMTGWGFSRFARSFWEDPKLWLDHSPLMHAPKVTTPTLLIACEYDLRTPPGQAEEFYTALKMHDVPTRLIVLKQESHGFLTKPSNVLRTQLYLRKWFGEWQRQSGSTVSSAVQTGAAP